MSVDFVSFDINMRKLYFTLHYFTNNWTSIISTLSPRQIAVFRVIGSLNNIIDKTVNTIDPIPKPISLEGHN